MKPEGYCLPRVDDPFAEIHVLDFKEIGTTGAANATAAAGPIIVSANRSTVNGLTFETERNIILEDLTMLLRAMGRAR